jgi:hypothetical protein
LLHEERESEREREKERFQSLSELSDMPKATKCLIAVKMPMTLLCRLGHNSLFLLFLFSQSIFRQDTNIELWRNITLDRVDNVSA